MLVARLLGVRWRGSAAAAVAAGADALEVNPAAAGSWINEAAAIIPVLIRPEGVAMLPQRLLVAWGESHPEPGLLPAALRQRQLDVALVRLVPALPSLPPAQPRRPYLWQGLRVAQVDEASSAYDGILAHARDGDLIVLGPRRSTLLDRLLYGGFVPDIAQATGCPVLVVGATHD